MRQSIIKLRRFVRPQAEALIWFSAKWDGLAAGTLSTQGHLRETINRNQTDIRGTGRDILTGLAAIQDHEDAKAATALGRNTYVLVDYRG